MSFHGKTKLSFQFKNLVKEKMRDKMDELLEEMIDITPVDTGDLKNNYELSEIKENQYKIRNDLTYAHQILAIGRVGKQGSEQLPDGILPFVSDFVNNN